MDTRGQIEIANSRAGGHRRLSRAWILAVHRMNLAGEMTGAEAVLHSD